MKHVDIQMILFVGASLIHDYWLIWGLPRVYYMDVRKEHLTKEDDDHDDRVA
ncbi:hypothetical protein [Fredinandcohnia sp. 179-A 10B2 NHS]|uniref:hypothetical protein n=1 Tax=Fredinandcohnia sp. 179-A 10B2 NHS TaxID=3235176 RepID=UPI00399FC561